MKVTVDLNVILDVTQHRAPHYEASEAFLHRARSGEFSALLPGHAITTVHYIIEKWTGTAVANQIIDGLLADFAIHPSDKSNFQRARQLPLKDFEDALVASIAEATRSDYIVTRNVRDFARAPVLAITPAAFLKTIVGTEAE